jgi:hypothetical protein
MIARGNESDCGSCDIACCAPKVLVEIASLLRDCVVEAVTVPGVCEVSKEAEKVFRGRESV